MSTTHLTSSKKTKKHHKKRHARFFHHRSKRGSTPGLVVMPSESNDRHNINISVLTFNSTELDEKHIVQIDQIPVPPVDDKIIWLDVNGVENLDVLNSIGEIYGLHPLALEDVRNVHQRPKVEDYKSNTFAIVRMPILINEELDLEQVSLFWGKNFVISFQEKSDDCFDPVRTRLKNDVKRIKLCNPTYFAYALMDAVVDSYFPLLENYGLILDELEDQVLLNPDPHQVARTHAIKRDLALIRHTIWSQRQAFANLLEFDEIARSELRFFIRDCEDHSFQLIDIIESYRERLNGLTDIYLSSTSNRLNEVMKMLTIIATIFMPLSFISGVYGMNFDRSVSPYNMPELGWYFGYPMAIGLMIVIASTFLLYFWRKGWIADRTHPNQD